MNLDRARTVADAVLYEGYLLYPYRATSDKNQARWQWGVLGPRGAAAAGLGEESGLSMQTLLTSDPEHITIHVRFLQLQRRRAQNAYEGGFIDLPELYVDGNRWFSWDEAVEVERAYSVSTAELDRGRTWTVTADAGDDVEDVRDAAGTLAGRLLRQRVEVTAELSARWEPVDGLQRLTLGLANAAAVVPADGKPGALQRSLIGTHLIIEGAGFVSVIDPPESARQAAEACRQHRCWPVLAGEAGSSDAVLGSPIILYDYPEIAGESTGSLFDATEIDEILTLRVLTMTEAEKADARATDPRAAEIIDRCENLSPADLQRLHGVMRDPHALASTAGSVVDHRLVPPEFAEAVAAVEQDAEMPWFDTGGQPWWDPAVDERVQPDVDAIVVNGVSVSKDSLVRLHPSRRADAQDLFFADQVARVTAVLGDVDGGVHVAVVLVDDPAADLHDWYGRYLYFAPDELEPLPVPNSSRKEHQS